MIANINIFSNPKLTSEESKEFDNKSPISDKFEKWTKN